MVANSVVTTAAAPPGPGGAAQGTLDARGYLATSIQYGVDPQTSRLVAGGAKAQMKQAMQNIAAVFTAAELVRSSIHLSIHESSHLGARLGLPRPSPAQPSAAQAESIQRSPAQLRPNQSNAAQAVSIQASSRIDH